MPNHGHRLRFLVVFSCLLAAPAARADARFATVSGTVADEFGGLLPGAHVTLVEEQTHEERRATTDEAGTFRFEGLPPGGYLIRVEMAGFRTLEWRGNPVGAGSHLAFGALALTVGTGETYVESGVKVDTQESQRVASITATQLEPIASRPGDLVTFMRLLPGVRYEDNLEAPGDRFGSVLPHVDGQDRSWNQVTVDGVNANELSSTHRLSTVTALGAVAEVQVFSSGYRAELGRTGGVNIRIVTKGGSSRHTLSPYWDERRSSWGSTPWSLDRDHPPPKAHFRRAGFTAGGPVRMPRESGTGSADKLFFFYSLESVDTDQEGPVRRFLVPTEAERRGDFSATFFSGSSRPVVIRDPLTGQPFPGNVIPPGRIDPSAQALLGQLPLPTSPGGYGGTNYSTRADSRSARLNHVLRLDWKPSTGDRLSVSLQLFDNVQEGAEISGEAAKWGFFDRRYDFGNQVVSLAHTRVWGPNAVNDLSLGARRQTERFGWASEADRRRTDRDAVGWRHGQFYPHLNHLNAIPEVQFRLFSGTTSVSPDFIYDDRLGESNHDLIVSLRDDVSWIRGPHALKAGLYVERLENNEAPGGSWMGVYDFGRDTRSALDTGFPYANALLGVFTRYEEWDARPFTENRSWLAEAYIQDTWRVAPRLTIDLGLRLLWYTPQYQADGRTSGFVRDRYDPARAPRLYRPVRVGGVDYGQDPVTGALVSGAYIGAYVPGTGDPTNGMVPATDPTYPRGFRENQGLHPEPRLGLAYDLTGDGKTALHVNAGLFHQARIGGGTQGNLRGPAIVNRGILLGGTAASLLDGPGLPLRPVPVRGIERDAKTPSSYKLSLGVQRDIGWGLVADVAYVGALGRHIEVERNINAVPDGARFIDQHPENRDPRFPGAALPSEFLRPISGWQSIIMTENSATSNYNALQASLSRRYMKGLQFGIAYTLSKALGIVDDNNFVDASRPVRDWHYGRANHDQGHALVASFTWDVPRLAHRLGASGLLRAVLDGWQVSGEYAHVGGDWAPVTLETTDGFDFDGGDGSVRPVMLHDPMADYGHNGTRDWDKLFDTTAFARPSGRGDYGNAPRNAVQLPGVHNVNLSLLKTVKIRNRIGVQLRLDAWNVFDHTQYSDVDRVARFDSSGTQVNPTFGTATAARRPRELQLSARFKLF